MFGFDSAHVLMAALGSGLVAAYWLPRFVSEREPTSAALLIAAGWLAYAFVPGMPAALDPLDAPVAWERLSELAVIVALFGTGLRIDDISTFSRWMPAARLLAVTMPLTIVSVALLGLSLAGMTLAGAVLLAAILAPTDPVLARDVQIGPPLEGGEHPVRFALTTEAGLNDGLAFPFIYLGLLIAADGLSPDIWGVEWILRDVLYRITAGALMGVLLGKLLGVITFSIPRRNALSATASGVVALAGVLVCYGATELVEGYGFIAVFVAGVFLRRAEASHAFHRRLHVFSESIEHALTALILILLGGALPALWVALDWRYLAVGIALILVIRPVAGWVALQGAGLQRSERGVIAGYGIRGVGSIYYVSYACGQLELVNEPQLWAMVAYTVFASTIIHGLTAGLVVDNVTRRA